MALGLIFNAMLSSQIHIPYKVLRVDPTTRITISKDPSINSMVYWEPLTEDKATLIVGKYCSIATKVSFYLGGNHNTKRISTYLPDLSYGVDKSQDLLTNGDIIIENDVWIGREATILSGVTIGTGSVIGTRAVVAKSVEPYSIVVGNPGRAIKKRFDDRQIEILLRSVWWNWDPEKIKNNAHIIFGESFEDFERLVSTEPH